MEWNISAVVPGARGAVITLNKLSLVKGNVVTIFKGSEGISHCYHMHEVKWWPLTRVRVSTEVRTTTGVKHFISTSVWEGCRVHCRQRATYSGRQCVTGVWGEGHCQCYRIYCMQSPSSCAQEGIYYEPDLFCSRQMPQQVMLSFKCTCQVLRTFWLYSYQVAQKLVKARVSWHIFKIFFLARHMA